MYGYISQNLILYIDFFVENVRITKSQELIFIEGGFMKKLAILVGLCITAVSMSACSSQKRVVGSKGDPVIKLMSRIQSH